MSASRLERRGSYAIEFALIVPFLVLALAGTVDFVQYLLLSDGLVAAVAEGARAGAQSEDDPTGVAQSVAKTSWTNAALPAELTLEAKIVGAAPDRWVQVEGSVPYLAWFGFIGLPETITYTSTVRSTLQ